MNTHLAYTSTRHRLRQQTGFTIVELLIVIVVIGILAAITIVAYNGVQEKAIDSRRESSIAAVAKGLELFYAENGFYPNYGGQVANLSWSATNLGLPSGVMIAPNDSPSAGASSFFNATSGDQNKYGYWNRGGTRSAPTGCTAPGCAFYSLFWYSESANEWREVLSANGG